MVESRSIAPLALVTLLGSGCVLPTAKLTGMELSWSFVEGNGADGDEARRYRSCAGADTTTVEVLVEDQGDEDRRRVFPFDCEEAYLTPDEALVTTRDLFIDLLPGRYDLRLQTFDGNRSPVMSTRREVLIEERGVNAQAFDLSLPLLAWSLTLEGLDGCGGIQLGVRYADPEVDLADLDPETEDPAAVPYRTALASDAGLTLDGQEVACDALADPIHNFVGMDRGRYLLDVQVDGAGCAVPFEVAHTAEGLTLDLANLPCDG